MPIAALPAATARSICSSLVITDATSVVKELVDNALDARTRAISVEIAANTLDSIQVKDIGTGIGVEDRQLLCKRGCTSKIKTIKDLSLLGGSSLGFRGEALSSIAEISGPVTITTRVDGEVVGSALKFGQAGQLLGCTSAADPVGTTVRVQDFLKAIPVRKQIALKASNKTLTSLRKLLYSYAFARPQVRFALKVLKNKHGKFNWTYASSPLDSLVEIASKIEGKEVASQCKEVCLDSKTYSEAGLAPGWEISALLINIEADFGKACNSSEYFSIDGCPVHAEKGLVRDISKLYKSRLDSALREAGRSVSISRPFFCARMTCPSGSYDLNVEPSKSDVVFANSHFVLHLFELLFEKAYGKRSSIQAMRVNMGTVEASQKHLYSSPDLLLARKASPELEIPSTTADNQPLPHKIGFGAAAISTRSHTEEHAGLTESISPSCTDSGEEIRTGLRTLGQNNSQITFKSMSMFDEEDLIDCMDATPTDESFVHHCEGNDNEAVRAITNPWSIAKMNANVKPHKVDRILQPTLIDSNPLMTPPARLSSTPEEIHHPESRSHSKPSRPRLNYMTPSISPDRRIPYQNPGPPMRRRVKADDIMEDDYEERAPQQVVESNPITPAKTLIENWVDSAHKINPSQSAYQNAEATDRNGEYVTSGKEEIQPLHSRSISYMSNSKSKDSNSSDSKNLKATIAFRSPLKSPGTARSADEARSIDYHSRFADDQDIYAMPIPRQNVVTDDSDSAVMELEQIMDFEHRKRATIAKNRHLVAKAGFNDVKSNQIRPPSTQNSVLDSLTPQANGAGITSMERLSRPNPHRNRYLAAVKNLGNSCRPAGRDVVTPGQVGRDSQQDRSAVDVSLMSRDDPRAYLIKLNRQNAADDEDSKAEPKASRIFRSRLPFETTPVNVATYNQATVIESNLGHPEKLHSILSAMKMVDSYVKQGKNDFVVWRAFSKRVNDWEVLLRELIRNQYRARIIDENVVPELELSLRLAVKAHIEKQDMRQGALW